MAYGKQAKFGKKMPEEIKRFGDILIE